MILVRTTLWMPLFKHQLHRNLPTNLGVAGADAANWLQACDAAKLPFMIPPLAACPDGQSGGPER